MNWYKNLKISVKLIIGFLIVAALAGVIGITGTISLNKVSSDANILYEKAAAPMGELSEVLYLYQDNRLELHKLILAERIADINDRIEVLNKKADRIKAIMAENQKTAVEESTKVLYDEFDSSYENYLKMVDGIIQSYRDGNKDEALAKLVDEDVINTAVLVQDTIKELVNKKVTGAKSQHDKIAKESKKTIIIMISLSVLGVMMAITLGLVISQMIGRPIGQMVDVAENLALGDISVAVDTTAKDETGKLARAFQMLVDNTIKETNIVEKLAQGDFSVEVELRSEKDILGKALRDMISKVNDLIANITLSATQVAGGARQISDSSMVLSEGSTEQANAIEELTASLEEISSKTKYNADNANHANELTKTVKTNADKGNEQMKEMLNAMDEINTSSHNINKIIKVIDDIAFQTNILALNAAVEAARAGQYGKGFAVVADEVRTLAAKSAHAAKETTELIENSIHKVNEGTRIATETADSLQTIVNDIDRVYGLIDEIASASVEQASGITQISQGIGQVSGVVQTNSATAEESAAASEELASQAELLKNMVSKFKLNSGKNGNNINYFNPETLDIFNL